MQTKCPHCQTIFKVSDEHLKAADGYVRCGICKEVFNALKDETEKQPLDNKQEQPKKTTAQKIETPVTENQTTPVEDKAVTDETSKTNVAATTADNIAQTDMFTTSSEAIKPELEPAPSEPKPVEADSTASKAEESAPVVAKPPVSTIKAETEEETATKEQSDIQTPIKAAEKPPAPTTPAVAPQKKEKIAEISASDTGNNVKDNNLFDGVQSKLIPDEYRIPELHNTYSIGQDLAWSLAILALTASLFIEYAWFNRNELIRNPELRPMISYFCTFADCNMMELREPDKIEMTTRNIYTHPNVKNALMISGTLVNHADFEQAYPNILIDFSDVRGQVIASRTFTPEDYLQIKATSLRPLAPELPIDFNIEIKDPGKNAMTYEFTFM